MGQDGHAARGDEAVGDRGPNTRVPSQGARLELELCAFARACLRSAGAGSLDEPLAALVAHALGGQGQRPAGGGPRVSPGPWTMARVDVEAPGALVEMLGGRDRGEVEAWLGALVHDWARADEPRLPVDHRTPTSPTLELCVSSLDLMSVRQRIGNGAFLGNAHAIDEAARYWLGHRERAHRASALSMYLDGSHHSGRLTVAVDAELIEAVLEYAHDDGGHVVDAVYWGLAHMLGHISWQA
jgi:hypothetical protein